MNADDLRRIAESIKTLTLEISEHRKSGLAPNAEALLNVVLAELLAAHARAQLASYQQMQA